MKIKTNPEDFKVDEKISLKRGGASFNLYRLTKRNWNTIDAIRAACAEKSVPFDKVRWGGRKDKQAVTSQYLTSPAQYDLSFKRHNVEIIKVGTCDQQMSPTKIKMNEFSVVIRDMSEDEAVCLTNEAARITTEGFINYFDEQRFGGSTVFLAELLTKRQFDRALKMWVCQCRADAPKSTRERKAQISKLWGNWQAISKIANDEEINAIRPLINDKDGVIRALRLIPREEFGMFISAYQSHIWNEVCGGILSKGIAADEIPTIAPELAPASEAVAGEIAEVLAKRGVRLSKLKLAEFKECGYFASFKRSVRVFPNGMETEIDNDELFDGRHKVHMKFSLPAGSYATMLFKEAAKS